MSVQHGQAAYQSLAAGLRAAILSGRYPEGVRLPTEAELAERHGYSRQTVRRAFQDLVAEGMVFRVPGRGSFAAPRGGPYLRQFGSIEDLMGLSQDTRMRVVAPLERRVSVEAAGRLRLDADAVYTVTFSRLHDGVPFSLTTVHLTPAAGRCLAHVPELTAAGETSSATVIGLLDARLPEPIVEAEQSITALGAPAEVASALGCDPGIPVLRIDRLYLTASGQAVELAVSHLLPEQFSYRLRLRRSVR